MKKLLKIYAFLIVLLLVFSGCDIRNDQTKICSGHIDSNDDGICDTCSVSVIVYIDFFAINDLHGKFVDTDSNEGVDELSSYLKMFAEVNPNVVLLSSGDMWQGGAESNLTKGLIITEWMNELDFVSMSLGNHEYDWGEEFIEANKDIAEFPFLAINIFDAETDMRVEYCDASVIIERNGIQIGIIGAIGNCYSSISGDKSKDIYIKTGAELTSLVKSESEKLRSAGADYIVYSIHDGYEDSNSRHENISTSELKGYYDTVLSNGYVDLVFEGHTHKKYVLIDEYGVYHLQGGGDNSGISYVKVKINSVNYNSDIADAKYMSLSTFSGFDDDPVVDDLLDKYEEDIELADVVLGYNSRERRSYEIKNLIARLYYEHGVQYWGDRYDIVLGGGFISTRSPYDLALGEVKYRDLQSILPFDNQLVLCSVKGIDLQRRFFETTNTNYYIYFEQYGEAIKNSIDPNGTYYIVVDKYSSSYAPNNLTVVEEYYPEIFARDLLAEYIKEGGLSGK